MTPLLLLAAGGAAVYFYLQSKDGKPPAPSEPSGSSPQPGKPPTTSGSQISVSTPQPIQEVALPQGLPPLRWGWPVPRWQDRAPVISDGFRKPRSDHNGVDIMFARIASDPFPIGSPNGTKLYVMPDAWIAVAAADGDLWSAGRTSRGFAVVLDHKRVATFYGHLEALFVPETKPPNLRDKGAKALQVKAGQPLGVIGADPLDKERIKHLHFELWRGVNDAVDPAPFMKSWEVFTPKEVAAFMPNLPNLVRNARPKRTRNEPDLVHVTDYWRTRPGRAARP